MTTLTLVRGLPGSGKSTIAKALRVAYGTAVTEHYEADMFFVGADGSYNFDANRLYAAHQWCQGITDEMLFYKKNVIVSNTFTTLKEMRPYYEIAQKNGATFNVILCQSNFGNIHDVPVESLDRMKNRFAYDLSGLFEGNKDA